MNKRGAVVDSTFKPEIPEMLGIAFMRIGRFFRSVFRQTDGSVVEADSCKCRVDWTPQFSVKRVADCPVDEHRIKAIQAGGDF